jgi:tRNA modification GTPase
MSPLSSDTIFALSSGALPSGIAVVRLSGDRSAQILQRIAGSVPEPRMAQLRTFRAPDGLMIDHGLVLFFPGPASATGEDCAEFHCHGGKTVVSALLQAIGSVDGCRLAEPGEFMRRAFLNGRYDLAQVESLADLIDAETESQRRLAISGFDGHVSALYRGWRERLLNARAFVEADLDFSDEGDVGDDSWAQASDALRELAIEMEDHLQGAQTTELVRDGLRVVIMGPPNAGKSSLLNALARRDVAIVSEEAGTTRDLIEVALDIEGQKVLVTDTAGIRDNSGKVETIGIERAKAAGNAADLVFWLQPVDISEKGEMLPGAIRLTSKADLLSSSDWPDNAFSTLTGRGIEDIVRRIRSRLNGLARPTGLIPVSLRHAALVRECQGHLMHAMDDPTLAVELRAERLRMASHALGRIAGSVDVEDLLGRIFSSFCIGK